MSWKDRLINGEQIKKTIKLREDIYSKEKIKHALYNDYSVKGWEIHKTLKSHYWIKKEKKIDEQFEDAVWCLLAKMGFDYMNKDRYLKIPYDSKNQGLSKQVDVLAIDDETILFVECKVSSKDVKGYFKQHIEQMKGYGKEIVNEVRRSFPSNPKRKIKFILATKNYIVSENDKELMKKFGIYHLDHNDMDYFSELSKHLGKAARFQFLGALFRGHNISSMENKIPAIRGKMGGFTYYSFVIEPYKLLKISYVSHRIGSNDNIGPAYQRLINKNRVNNIRKFIDKGGFFPNSLIVSLDTGGKSLDFDFAGKELKVDSDLTRIGILHLPQKYSSAYIIDGQHRLYGYSESKYNNKNSIPVVAFENLDREKQVELFMEINENQKKVPKHLQNTLNADLLWDDNSSANRRKAIRLQTAIDLGIDPNSPLFERIKVDERSTHPKCNITIETIDDALKQSNFLTKFDSSDIVTQHGYLDLDSNEKTRNLIYSLLSNIFQYAKTNLEKEWELEGKDGVLITNNSIFGLIKIVDDIIDHLVQKGSLNYPIRNLEPEFRQIKYFIDPLIIFYENISDAERNEIKKFYGSGGKINTWRKYQQIIKGTREDFCPEGLLEWERKKIKEINSEAYKMIFEIEDYIKQDLKRKLISRYGSNFFTTKVPHKIVKSATSLATEKDLSGQKDIHTTNPWDCLYFIDYREIVTYGDNWQNLFKEDYSYPVKGKDNKSSSDNTSWMVKVNEIRNKTHHNNPITREEFMLLERIYNWLLKE